MNKILFLCTFLFASLSAIDFDVEARAGYFYPMSSGFKKIYRDGELYGAEVGAYLCDEFQLWASANHLARRGKSGGSFENDFKTRVTYTPFAAGFKFLIPIECWMDLYFGLGAQYARFHTSDNSSFGGLHHSKKYGWGGIVKLGVLIDVTDCIYLNLFSDYSFIKMSFHNSHHGIFTRHNSVLDGWIFGVGVGVHL